MKNDKVSVKGSDERKARRSRWRKDANGKLHYAGVCPFNNAVCWLRNHAMAWKDSGNEEVL
jgi:hypothetical protein